MTTDRFILAGSNRVLVPGSVFEQEVSPDEVIDITLRLRSRVGDLRLKADAMAELPLKQRHYIAQEDCDKLLGSDPDQVSSILAIARQHGIEIAVSPTSSRTLKARVPAGRVQEIFGSVLGVYALPDHTTYRGRQGTISFPPVLPSDVAESVQGVFGLDNRRQASPCISWVESVAAITSNTFPASYALPPGLDGTGQCIGVLEFGGVLSREQIGAVFGIDIDNIQAITVGNLAPGDFRFEVETGLDLTIISQLAPKARIACYFAPATEQGWVDALDTAIHDAANRPAVLSISWGWVENDPLWTQNAIDAVDELLAEAALLGITICVSSGDNGPYLDLAHHPRVLFPASSRYSLTCGGTMLVSGQEQVWNNSTGASGGGVSVRRQRPTWQPRMPLLKTPDLPDVTFDGRLLPDVASVANRMSTAVNGAGQTTSGTSAAAPLWAALLACTNQKLQALGKNHVGHLTPLLYQSDFTGSFTDILCVSNGSPGYLAGPRWDACTGWGSPKGPELIGALLKSASAA
jgi:kumamolisin